MLKKITMGKSPFKDLYQVFKMDSPDELESRRARLFPIGNSDSETSTVSIFLASLGAVKEYREELLSQIGIKKINNKNIELHTYTEVSGGNSENRPDGLLVITSGKHNPVIEWAGFVEAKVRDNTLDAEQIERYVDFAREIGINDIITVSNYLSTTPMDSPITSKKNKFNLYHWSWTYLKVTASRLIRTEAIEDTDHIFMLRELRKYFDTHKNINNYVHMGQEWKNAVAKIHTYSDNQSIDKETVSNIVESFKQEEKDISLQLTDRSNHYIELVTKSNREDEIEEMLQNKKVITSTFMIDNNKNCNFSIDVCFKSRTIRCYTRYVIDKGQAKSQTSSLIKKLDSSGTTDDIKINAYYIRNKSNMANKSLTELNKEKEQAEYYSILDKSLGNKVKFFEIETIDTVSKSFTSTKNFIVKLENIAEVFLNQVMEYLPATK